MTRTQRTLLIAVGAVLVFMAVVSMANGFANRSRIDRWHVDTDHGVVECVGDYDHPSCDWDHPEAP